MLTSVEIKIVAGLALVVALLIGVWAYNAHEQALGAAQFKADAATQALAAEQEAHRESDRRAVAIQGTAHEADLRASAARADAGAARSADDRLRLRLAAAERDLAAIHPGAAHAGAPADRPAAVPYDVFAGVDDAAGQLGNYADQLRVSLDACIGSYRALTP